MENKYHFLDENGEHAHEIKIDGEWKQLIGTSTATGIISKPLAYWASGMAVGHLGWIHPRPRIAGKYIPVPDEKRVAHITPYFENLKKSTPEKYLKALDEAYKAHAKKLTSSAKTGTDMHADLEAYVNKCLEENKGTPTPYTGESGPVAKFADWACENVDRFIFTEHHCYSEKLWLGGIIDCGAVMKDGKTAIVDFKSSKDAYFNQFIQVALYDLQVRENGLFDKDGNQTIADFKADEYYVIPFGAKDFYVARRKNIDDFQRNALSALDLYKGQLFFNQ